MDAVASPTVKARAAAAVRPRALPAYSVPDTRLGMGASVGNSSVWVNTKGTGAIERIFCIPLGESLVGAVSIRYAATASPLQAAWDPSAHDLASAAYVPLRRETPGSYELHPAYQHHTFCVGGYIHITETTFVPLAPSAAPPDEHPIAFQIIALRRNGLQRRAYPARVFAAADFINGSRRWRWGRAM